MSINFMKHFILLLIIALVLLTSTTESQTVTSNIVVTGLPLPTAVTYTKFFTGYTSTLSGISTPTEFYVPPSTLVVINVLTPETTVATSTATPTAATPADSNTSHPRKFLIPLLIVLGIVIVVVLIIAIFVCCGRNILDCIVLEIMESINKNISGVDRDRKKPTEPVFDRIFQNIMKSVDRKIYKPVDLESNEFVFDSIFQNIMESINRKIYKPVDLESNEFVFDSIFQNIMESINRKISKPVDLESNGKKSVEKSKKKDPESNETTVFKSKLVFDNILHNVLESVDRNIPTAKKPEDLSIHVFDRLIQKTEQSIEANVPVLKWFRKVSDAKKTIR
ncbi:hypothetical protein Glove_219g50 [Diversispora epigaea]|uniref:Uncharacterized protein n=1 Tax=Diversispora epigaea TaxID=1348612 RepID=A0A397INP9_9GLOM|nr:hypothetical protein Glove_219g50 [Diversispora epigaea]